LRKAEPFARIRHQSYQLEECMLPCENDEMKQCLGLTLSFALLLSVFALPLAASDPILPEGTRITLQLNDNLSTSRNSEGDSFTAVVTHPVLLGERMAIPKGSVVTGSISRILRPGRFKGKAVMYLLFQSISIPGRGNVPIVATLVRIDPEGNGGVHSEGGVKGEGSTGPDVGRVLTPGIVGAGIGALGGGGKGAAIGGGVGTAIGLATVFTTRGKDLEVQRGSTMDISLDRPLAIPPEGEDAAAKNR
jgi:hypothetical protein